MKIPISRHGDARTRNVLQDQQPQLAVAGDMLLPCSLIHCRINRRFCYAQAVQSLRDVSPVCSGCHARGVGMSSLTMGSLQVQRCTKNEGSDHRQHYHHHQEEGQHHEQASQCRIYERKWMGRGSYSTCPAPKQHLKMMVSACPRHGSNMQMPRSGDVRSPHFPIWWLALRQI